ncbi:hemolysin family protein [Actinocorallia populi]|uniref:hemolysin family protein n=1 Tax=Actinocorallia populi TaxID=2079200 RepID=UPI000D08EB1D|nr:hemolysin family protein [Actinocorallia populi]
MTVLFGLAAVFILTAATGYFVAQEFAYVTADRIELEQAAREGDKKAARAVRVLERLSFMLSGAQLGITVTTLVVGFIAEPALAQLIRPLLDPLGVPDAAVGGVALALGFVLAIVIQMVLGELFPKNLALARPETLARVLAPSTLVYLTVASPLIRFFDSSANRVLRTAGIEPVEELHHGATLEELGLIIGESEEEFADEHVHLLERALVFSDHTADQAMIPRIDVVTIPAEATADEIVEIIGRHGHTHYPVVGERVDDIVGVLGLRQLLPVGDEEWDKATAGLLAREALLVPDSLPLPEVIVQMQERRDEIAVVIDEYGGFAGLLTLEDVAEELVGDISDETDQEIPQVRPQDEWWHLDAGLRIDEIDQLIDLELPEGDYDTLAGLILHRLGRFAEPGDVIEVEEGGRTIEIEVLSKGHHVPEKVRLRERPGRVEESR